MSNIEDEYLDVLQNIEFSIVMVYREDPGLIDVDVLDAVDALVRHYGAEENGRRAPEYRLADKPLRVFSAGKDACEWRLGRKRLAEDDEDDGPPITVSELVECLRRVQKSIRRWTRQGGRKGYLDFVSQYVI